MKDENTIRKDELDKNDWQYYLGGMLIGTRWKHPDYGEIVINKVRQGKEHNGREEMYYPEITLKYVGKSMTVRDFLRRTDVNDLGDIEPNCEKAQRIVDIQEFESWSQMAVSFEQ